jgi:prepilin-type N-terminal cleavage/methylation domain-containing protein
MKNKKGFTIVELVIVIAVIAILAAVLIPTFTTVTANARASAALSVAKNAQTAVLGNSEGSMPEGTMVAVTNDNDAYAEYIFVVSDRKLESKKLDSISASSAYPYSVEATYTVFVTADYFDAEKHSKVSANVEGLVADVLDRKLSGRTKEGDANKGVLTSKSTTDQDKDFSTWTYLKKDGVAETDTVSIKVYYNADIADTCVVFFAN